MKKIINILRAYFVKEYAYAAGVYAAYRRKGWGYISYVLSADSDIVERGWRSYTKTWKVYRPVRALGAYLVIRCLHWDWVRDEYPNSKSLSEDEVLENIADHCICLALKDGNVSVNLDETRENIKAQLKVMRWRKW